MTTSTAQSILDFYPNFNDQILKAEDIAQEFLQEWHEEKTVYSFEDGSSLIFVNDTVEAVEE